MSRVIGSTLYVLKRGIIDKSPLSKKKSRAIGLLGSTASRAMDIDEVIVVTDEEDNSFFRTFACKW